MVALNSSLESSQRFKDDWNRYKTAKSTVKDESVKREIDSLLSSLLAEVKKIDQHHNDLLQSKLLPTGIEETRQRITEIRKKLDELIKK